MRRCLLAPILMISALVLALPVLAGKADVVEVKVRKTGNGIYAFDVTVRHADAGWSHYADKWDILAPDGRVLGSRVLLHPHDDEQPFTRSLDDVRIPAGIGEVTVRAHDKKHGYGGKALKVKLPQ